MPIDIVKYMLSECHIYTPYEIQEGFHLRDENLGATIKVNYEALPQNLKDDEALVAVAISQWYYSDKPVPRPSWIVD